MTSPEAAPNKRRRIDYGVRFQKDKGPSDCTIACGNIEFRAHRAVLSEKSDYLQILVNGKTAGDSISIDREGPRYVQAVLHWMYKGDYDDGQGNDLTLDPPMIFNVKLHGLANRWEMADLKDLATMKLGVRLEEAYDETEYLETVRLVYSGPSKKSPELGNKLACEAASHFAKLSDAGALKTTFEKHGRFAADVMEQMAARFPEYRCTSCGRKVVMEKLDEAEDISPRCIYCSKGRLKLFEPAAEAINRQDRADSEGSDGPLTLRARRTRYGRRSA